MSLLDRTIVLIVGAGPTGPVAAVSLLHQSFHDFIKVFPRLSSPLLEALDTTGCGHDIVSQGTQRTSFKFHIGTRSSTLCSPHVGSLNSYTRHPYILLIPQNVTESILEKKLLSFGVVVHRLVRVVGLRPNAVDPQTSNVMFQSDDQGITAKYIIGADGAHLAVRTMIGLSDPMIIERGENNL